MAIDLILTNDWELFGDGSGDFNEIMEKPTRELISILRDNDAKMTLMAEVGQQWLFKSLGEHEDYFRHASAAWEDLVREFVSIGSDVQLHFHPQWRNATFEDGKWKLNMSRWAISALPENEVFEVLSKGKAFLEKILQPVDSSYRCIAFRAGAYCIQPEKHVLTAMKNAGFIADTSVTKGMAGEGYYDFTDANSNIIPWFADFGNINKKINTPQAILEMPICSLPKLDSAGLNKYSPALNYALFSCAFVPSAELKWLKEREHIKNKRYPREQRFYKSYQNKNLAFYLKALLARHYVQLDYDYLPATLFVKMLGKLLKSPAVKKFARLGLPVPVIASGHIKDVQNCDNIQKIISFVKKEYSSEIQFRTLRHTAENWHRFLSENPSL